VPCWRYDIAHILADHLERTLPSYTDRRHRIPVAAVPEELDVSPLLPSPAFCAVGRDFYGFAVLWRLDVGDAAYQPTFAIACTLCPAIFASCHYYTFCCLKDGTVLYHALPSILFT